MAKEFGVEEPGNSMGATFFDYNKDGLLDLYVLNNVDIHILPANYRTKITDGSSLSNDRLYKNNGDGTFTEKEKEYEIDDNGNSVQATFFYYDEDGDLDLYVANYPPTNFNAPNRYYQYKMDRTKDSETDKLFRNDGDTFTNVTDEDGLRSFDLTLNACASSSFCLFSNVSCASLSSRNTSVSVCAKASKVSFSALLQ